MGFWVYPQDYVPPVSDPPLVLNAEQRDFVKTRMQTYIINEAKPVFSNELISLAQERLLASRNILVDENQLEQIIREILSEWGAPDTGEDS